MLVAQEKTGHCGFSTGASRSGKKRRRKTMPGKYKLMLTGLVLAGLLTGILVIYYYSQVFALGYRIHCLKKELALLRVENHHLAEEIYRLSSLDRVEYLAINKLGMVRPDNSNILVVPVASGIPDMSGPEPVRPAGISPTVEEKSRLIKAFTELVNRLENRIWLGLGIGAGSEEGTNGYNKYINSETDSLGFFNSCTGVYRPDFSPGLASTC